MCIAESVQAGTDAHRKDTGHSWAAYGTGFCLFLVSINNLDAKLLKELLLGSHVLSAGKQAMQSASVQPLLQV